MSYWADLVAEYEKDMDEDFGDMIFSMTDEEIANRIAGLTQAELVVALEASKGCDCCCDGASSLYKRAIFDRVTSMLKAYEPF